MDKLNQSRFRETDNEEGGELLIRDAVDLEIGRVMRDVSVPTGLQSRILEAVERAATPQPATETAAETGTSRETIHKLRRSWRLAAALAATLAVAVGLALWTPWQTVHTMAGLREGLNLNLAVAPDFDGSFSARLPAGWVGHGDLRVGQRAKGFPSDGSHQAALFPFSLNLGRGRMLDGVLVAIPAGAISDPPEATAFRANNRQYTLRDGVKFAAVAWTEQDTVYMCFVQDGALNLEAMERAFEIVGA